MECKKCGEKMKVMKTASENNRTYRAYKCKGCGEYLYSEERCEDSAKGILSKIMYGKIKKSIEK